MVLADHPYLSDGYEPLRLEGEQAHLVLEGRLPPDLGGTFYRIGPNPQFAPRLPYNPLNADGMVHAFSIGDGRVGWRNRWVRTEQWKRDRAAGRALFGTSGMPSDRDESVLGLPTDGLANTNLTWHGGRLLALEEGHGPIEIDPASLETLGGWSFDGRLPRNLTAHPKIDPLTGEMLAFANFPTGRASGELALYGVDRSGALTWTRTIEGPFAALIHDFAITANFFVVPYCPVTVLVRRAMAGGPLIAWEPDLGLKVAVVPRQGGEVRWFEGPAAMAWHTVNAFEQDGTVIVDVCQQDAAVFPLADGAPTDPALSVQRLVRWTLDPASGGRLTVQRLAEDACEYPRIDERRTGMSYRHAFVACCGGPGSGDPFHRGIGHFDHRDGRFTAWHAGPRCAVAEPVFAPRPDGREGEGYLITNIFDEERRASHLAIFDATDVPAGPILRAYLDVRVPVGFHGQWLAADRLE